MLLMILVYNFLKCRVEVAVKFGLNWSVFLWQLHLECSRFEC